MSYPARPRPKRTDVRSVRVLTPGWTPSVSAAVAVVSVTAVSATQLRWTFASPVSAVPLIAALSGLQASSDAEGNYYDPSAVTRSGTSALILTYPTAAITSGQTPKFIAQDAPVGLTFAAGTLAAPQEGEAVVPFALAAQFAKQAKRVGRTRAQAVKTAVAGRIGRTSKRAA